MECLKDLKDIPFSSPHLEKNFHLALEALERNDYSGARKIVEDSLPIYDDPHLHCLIGIIYSRTWDEEIGKYHFLQAVQEEVHCFIPYLELGKDACKKHEFANARVLLSRSIRIRPCMENLFFFGRYLYQMGKWEKALDYFEGAQRQNYPLYSPDFNKEDILFYRAKVLIKLEKYSDALVILESLSGKIKGKSAPVLELLCRCYSYLGRHEDAMMILDIRLKVSYSKDEMVQLLIKKSEIYANQGDHYSAYRHLSRALDVDDKKNCHTLLSKMADLCSTSSDPALWQLLLLDIQKKHIPLPDFQLDNFYQSCIDYAYENNLYEIVAEWNRLLNNISRQQVGALCTHSPA